MKKLLYCASNNRHMLHFHLPYIKMLEDMGIKVDILSRGDASDFPNNDFYNINFEKSITSLKNFSVVKSIKKVLVKNEYDYIYLNTSLTAALVRLALPQRLLSKTKVINVCHGYFFDSNVPFHKNMLYIGVEKLLKSKTDHIVTMNKADYDYVKSLNLCKSDSFFVHGMGLNTKKYTYLDGISDGDYINIIYVAEHSPRKNHNELFIAIANAKQTGSKINLHLAGDGKLFEANKTRCQELGISDDVIFYGYTNDILSVYQKCDYSISTSKIEGLPFNVMESLACGLPCIVSDCKGNIDLIEDEKNGYIYELSNINELSYILSTLEKGTDKHKSLKEYSTKSIEINSIENTTKEFYDIFSKLFS